MCKVKQFNMFYVNLIKNNLDLIGLDGFLLFFSICTETPIRWSDFFAAIRELFGKYLPKCKWINGNGTCNLTNCARPSTVHQTHLNFITLASICHTAPHRRRFSFSFSSWFHIQIFLHFDWVRFLFMNNESYKQLAQIYSVSTTPMLIFSTKMSSVYEDWALHIIQDDCDKIWSHPRIGVSEMKC